MTNTLQGAVTWYNEAKQFGYLTTTPDVPKDEYFVRKSNLLEVTTLSPGDKVTFQLAKYKDLGYEAINVQIDNS